MLRVWSAPAPVEPISRAAASGSWKTYAGRGIFRPELKKNAAPQGGGKDQSKTVLDPVETLAYVGPKAVQLMGGSKETGRKINLDRRLGIFGFLLAQKR